MKRPLGAQISHMLKDRGVEVIFGIPGVHNQELYRGIEEAGLRHVLARHEQGAGFMADGYARATGGFGVCYLITGPGLLNALTPLGQAYSDNVSVLAIASCLEDDVTRKGQLHQMRDQQAAAEAVCAWSRTARTAEAAYGLIDAALGSFETGDPRPKAVHATISALEAMADPAPARPKGAGCLHPDPRAVAEVRQRLSTARKPMLIVGGGAKGLVGPLIGGLLDRVAPATFCSFAGRGIVPLDYPLHYGPFLTRPDSARAVAEADCVLALGTQLAEVDIWRDHLGHGPGSLIRVDTLEEALATPVDADLLIRSDTAAFVAALLDGWDAAPTASDWDATVISRNRSQWRAEVDTEFPGIQPVMEALRSAMPQDAMIYSDMTKFAYAAKECWDMARSGHWHHPSGFGTLGYALPASIGGAVARPGLPTCCIHGDYGLQYTLPELGTAVELGLPLPVILWDNAKLGAIEDSMIAAQIAPNAVIQKNPDFLALARAYGADAQEPATLSDIGAALRAAFDADRPTLLRLTPGLLA